MMSPRNFDCVTWLIQREKSPEKFIAMTLQDFFARWRGCVQARIKNILVKRGSGSWWRN